jgi:hypothetical protein
VALYKRRGRALAPAAAVPEGATAVSAGVVRPATHARHSGQPFDAAERDGTPCWITRAKNFAVVVWQVKKGSVLERPNTLDESMLLLPPGVTARIESTGETIDSTGDSLTILPPGASRVEIDAAGVAVRIYSRQASDIIARASNNSVYADEGPEVAPLVLWPEPVGGFRLRHYDLAAHASVDPSPLKMRLFRSTNLMVNVFLPWTSRRDERNLSPHSHDDFEQISLALQGSFIHHIRYPWTEDKTTWRNDEHEAHQSPSVVVIPARAIHTSQDVGNGIARLVDIFGPPRLDFSLRPGFVINADEYPMPAHADERRRGGA